MYTLVLSHHAKGNDHFLVCKGLAIYKEGDEIIGKSVRDSRPGRNAFDHG